MLVAARLAVKFLPSAWLFAWADRPPKRPRRFAIGEADWVAWAVDHVASKPGFGASCLPRAVAAHEMLRRRGIASRLLLGVARKGEEVTAHAWIEAGGKKVVGGEEAEGFVHLAGYGAMK